MAIELGDDLTALSKARLALGLRERKQRDRALQLARQARSGDDADGVVNGLTYWAVESLFPPWHFAMLNDHRRTRHFRQALEDVVTPSSVVLEAGAGAGLLSLLAARAGAEHVYACEHIPELASLARKIIAENGYADRITVISKPIEDLRVGVDLPSAADILLFDHISCDVLGYGAMAVLEAASLLTRPGASVVPCAVDLRGRIIDCASLAQKTRVDQVETFDFSLANQFAPPFLTISNFARDLRHLSGSFDIFHFDFGCPLDRQRQRTIEVAVTHGGTAHGLMIWLNIWFRPELGYETSDFDHPDFRRPQFMPFVRPLVVEEGECLKLRLCHDRSHVFLQNVSGES